jgi:hypothetical protein
LPGQFPHSFDRVADKRRRQDEGVRRPLLAAQLIYCWRNRSFKKVRVRATLGDYTAQAIAMAHYTDSPFESLTECPAQGRPQKIRERNMPGRSQAEFVARNIQGGKLIREHLTVLLR